MNNPNSIETKSPLDYTNLLHISVLLSTVSLLMVFFRYETFVHEDALRYAIGIKRLSEHLVDSPATLFNFRMSFAYYLLTRYIYESGFGLEPLTIFHTLSALSTVILAYVIYKFAFKLSKNSYVALLCSLLSILSPSIWFISRNGHPLILATAIAFGALWFFTNRLEKDRITQPQWIFLSLLLAISISFRLDLLLIWGVFPALIFFFHGTERKSYYISVFAAMALALVLNYLSYRLLIQSWSENAEALLDLQSRLPSISYILSLLLKALARNSSLWVLGVGLLNTTLAALSFIFISNVRFIILFLAATLPYLVFIPFWGGDTSRYIIPTIAFFSLLSAKYIYEKLGFSFRAKHIISLLLIVGVLFGGSLSFPLVSRMYHFKQNIEGYPICCVPIDNYLRDYQKRKAFSHNMDETAHQVAACDRGNVLIVQLTGSMYQIYYLEAMNRLVSEKGIELDGVIVRKYATPENDFFVFEPEYNFEISSPITKLLKNDSARIDKVHLTPGSSELSDISGGVFLNHEKVKQLLGYEKRMYKSRTRLR